MSSTADRAHGPMDAESFRRFAPLLQACQRYASHSGCRFRSESFSGIPTQQDDEVIAIGPARSRDSGPRLAAKLSAAPVVHEFGERLRSGEEGLVEEIDRAFRVVMAESVRNAMMGMFQALSMFPPSPPPRGVEDDDCAYEDMAAALPVIAQRLYNDQVRRVSDTTGGPSRLERRAMTAAFLVDFADGVGWKLPQMSDTQQSMLKEFAERTAEHSQEGQANAREAFLSNLGRGSVAEGLRAEASKWWKDNWKSVLWTTAGAAVVAAAAVAGAALAHRAERQQRRSSSSER